MGLGPPLNTTYPVCVGGVGGGVGTRFGILFLQGISIFLRENN
jgi:hypothetical protein